MRLAIQKVKLRKAPGKDNITPKMVKSMGEEGIKELLEIKNEVMRTKKTGTRE